jgi:hypothetical protein
MATDATVTGLGLLIRIASATSLRSLFRIITGAGSNQKGTAEGYRLRGQYWPERWILGTGDWQRATVARWR